MSINTPFNHPLLRDSLFDLLETLPEGPPTEVGVLGSGPFDAADFDDFLRWLGLATFVPSAREGVLVIGRDDWTEEDLRRFVTSTRHGSGPRVYSQEMFLYFLLTGYDPHDLDPDERATFTEGHGVFAYLAKQGFAWPSTNAPPGSAELPVNWRKVGLLKHLGYSVGRSGLPRKNRQRILRAAFLGPLPTEMPPDYTAEWGKPRSAVRLKKIACSIAAFCRNARRRDRPPDQAIDDWEQDLRWLKRTYYEGRFSFRWPTVPREGASS